MRPDEIAVLSPDEIAVLKEAANPMIDTSTELHFQGAERFDKEVLELVNTHLEDVKSRRNYCLEKADEYDRLASKYKNVANQITKYLATDNSEQPEAMPMPDDIEMINKARNF